jgi:hypothetical protein
MNLLNETMNGLGAALLSVAAGLLFEELTFGGLVRLLFAPRPETRRCGVPSDRSSSMGCRLPERNHKKGEGR